MLQDSNLRAKDKIDVIGNFTAIFSGENVLLGGKAFPLGQISTDVLNMSQRPKQKLPRRRNMTACITG